MRIQNSSAARTALHLLKVRTTLVVLATHLNMAAAQMVLKKPRERALRDVLQLYRLLVLLVL